MTGTTMTIQDANVTALEDLTDPAREVIVFADAVHRWDKLREERVPDMATELCSNDPLDGKGCCYGPTGDPLCLRCQIDWIEWFAVAGSTFAIEVYA